MPLDNKIILDRLRQLGIIAQGKGARSADVITENGFDTIIKESKTKPYGYK